MRVFLADDNFEVRAALRLLVEQRLGYKVVGASGHTQGLLGLVATARADLVLLDWELPGGVDAALLRQLSALSHRPRVIILSCEPERRGEALASGAHSFASKGDGWAKMLFAIAAALGSSPSEA